MATTILTVGFIGLIQAVTICSGMMDQARRQTLANQILDHEIEQLRFLDWPGISALSTAPQSLIIDSQFDGDRLALGDNLTASAPVKFTATRVVNDVVDSLRQVTITVTWVVTSSRKDTSGSAVQFTYSRVNSAYLGNNGLNLSYQR